MTANLFCEMKGWEPKAIFLIELRRVLAKTIKHFEERNAEKINPVNSVGRHRPEPYFDANCTTCTCGRPNNPLVCPVHR